jgi:L-threonylcarbamoyladenylate synthase
LITSNRNLEKAVQLIKSGELVAFPTETVYGLGANALDKNAVQKIFALKGRPSNNPLIVHCHSVEQIAEITICDDITRTRLEKISIFWPGPLSVALQKSSLVPDITTANLNSVAVRIPNHPLALELLRLSNIPLAAPSANPSNYVSPTTAAHVRESFGDCAPFILDGGACSVGIESTVLSLTTEKPTILRLGAISKQQLEERLGEEVLQKNNQTHSPQSPGQLSVHYSPKTKCILEGSVETSSYPAKVGLISFSTDKNLPNYSYIVTLTEQGTLEDAARMFYAALRELDSNGLDLIVIERCEQSGIGEALMDRITRATAK